MKRYHGIWRCDAICKNGERCSRATIYMRGRYHVCEQHAHMRTITTNYKLERLDALDIHTTN